MRKFFAFSKCIVTYAINTITNLHSRNICTRFPVVNIVLLIVFIVAK